MKTRIIFSAFLALFLFGSTYTAQAQASPKVKKRQVTQQKRIAKGVKSGELTKRETVQLQRQQVNIQRTKTRAKADGHVTKAERARIHHKQNKASASIARKKNNRIDRN